MRAGPALTQPRLLLRQPSRRHLLDQCGKPAAADTGADVPWQVLRDAGHQVVFATGRADTSQPPILGC
jgi:hypothetical protein